jgi:hypothetical protein
MIGLHLHTTPNPRCPTAQKAAKAFAGLFLVFGIIRGHSRAPVWARTCRRPPVVLPRTRRRVYCARCRNAYGAERYHYEDQACPNA